MPFPLVEKKISTQFGILGVVSIGYITYDLYIIFIVCMFFITKQLFHVVDMHIMGGIYAM